MYIDLEKTTKMEEYIELLAYSVVESFYPTALIKYVDGLTLNEAVNFLDEYVEKGKLCSFFEVKCDGEFNQCFRNIGTVNKLEEAQDIYLQCDMCGKDVDVTEDNAFVKYKFVEKYKVLMRAKLKKKEIYRTDKRKLREDIKNAMKVAQTAQPISVSGCNITFANGDKGGIEMTIDKSINTGDLHGGNNNLNTGDNVQQSIKIENDPNESLFLELFKEIHGIADEAERSRMEYFAEQLKQAYATKNKPLGQQMIGFLKDKLSSVGSLASIASLFGMTL